MELALIRVVILQVIERQKGCGCLPSCGLLSGSRAARYAAKGNSSSVCFTLTRQAAPRATTWVLQTDGDGLAGAVRVEQLRGEPWGTWEGCPSLQQVGLGTSHRREP